MNDASSSSSTSAPPCILWSCITRNDIVLVEAGTDPYDGIVTQTAQELLLRPLSPGYEFHTISQPNLLQRAWQGKPNPHQGKLSSSNSESYTSSSSSSSPPPRPPPTVRGIKFHVYEPIDDVNDPDYVDIIGTVHYQEEKDNKSSSSSSSRHKNNKKDHREMMNFRIWIFAAVYDTSRMKENEVQGFLEKMVELTMVLRETSLVWKTCGTLGLQYEFANTLQQRMYEIHPMDPKIRNIQTKLQYSYEIMSNNIEMILDQQERIESLSKKTEHMNEMAQTFRKRTRDVKRMKMWQNAKYGMVLGTAVTVGVGIVVVPPLVAIL
jgi:Synaptobrevin